MRSPMPAEEIVFLVDAAIGGGFNARACGASVFTQADSIPELRDAARDAVECHFESPPPIIRLRFPSGDVVDA